MLSTLNELPSPPTGKTGWPWTEQSVPWPDLKPPGEAWPRLSIVTPAYNQGQFIEETIRSVLLQGYPNLEYIIVDGGSRDGSVDIIRKYEPFLAYWVSEPDGGQSDAINKGWQIATGEIIAWINSDDYYLPGAFRHVIREFSTGGHLAVLAGECIFVNVTGKQIGKKGAGSFDPVIILTQMMPAQSATFFHRKALDEVGFLNEDYHYCMDREYILRLAKHYYPEQLKNIDVPLAGFRMWGESKTESGSKRAILESKQIIDAYISEVSSRELREELRRKSYSRVYFNQAIREREKRNNLREIFFLLMVAYYSRSSKYIRKVVRRILELFGVNKLKRL